MRKCILHFPNKINLKMRSASQYRPQKMIEAFAEIGYEADIISGYGKERKKQIKQIKQNIQNGIKYDFLYAESSTMPTLLTEKTHLPFYPLLDFNFFRYCKKNGIKIGLFYRDIHWKFDQYKKNINWIKARISIIFYKYDLKRYNELLDVLYLPSMRMFSYMEKYFSDVIIKKELPPGCIVDESEVIKIEPNQKLNVFYVGGISGIYKQINVLKAISKCENIQYILCCRREEWETVKSIYEPYLTENIEIIHKSGDELIPYYQQSEIGILPLADFEYLSFAIPYKFYEYAGHGLTLIGAEGTAMGDKIETFDIGLAVDDSDQSIFNALKLLANDRELLEAKRENAYAFARENRWVDRANQVVQDLKTIQ